MPRKRIHKNAAARQKAHRMRMTELGLKACTCYVHPDDRNALHRFAELLCEKRGIYKSPAADPLAKEQ